MSTNIRKINVNISGVLRSENRNFSDLLGKINLFYCEYILIINLLAPEFGI